MNRFLRSGVLLVPSHITQPDGIEPIEPDHIIMPPDGNAAVAAAVTKAVVAIWVVLVPGEAVVDKGVPVNVGEADKTMLYMPGYACL